MKNGNNDAPMFIKAYGNPFLPCIEMDDPTWAYSNWTFSSDNVDLGVEFSNNCVMCTAGIEEIQNIQKELIKVTNLMGQDVDEDSKGLIIKVYYDGSIEKVFIID
jgi:hypothetical protein